MPETLPITHLGHVASLDIAERVQGAIESVIHCAIHTTPHAPDAIRRAVFDAMYRMAVNGLQALHGVYEPGEFGLAEGTQP